MAFKVAVTSSRLVDDVVLGVLNDAGFDVVHRPCETEDEVIETARDADGLLVYFLPLTPRRVLEAMPRMKVIGRHGVGVDCIDVRAATELGICVCNTPGVNTTEVADHAMAMLLSITRRIPMLSYPAKQGWWSDNYEGLYEQRTKLTRIAGKTVGIIGLGNIGRAFAMRVRGFSPARIIASDPYVPQTVGDLYGVEMVELDTLLADSDFISLHTPSNEETYHLMNETTLGKMKPAGVLINTSRGPVVDETALNAALESGGIAAAAIDVAEEEPLSSDSPLLERENLIVTPHFAGYSEVSDAAAAFRWPDNIVRVLNGRQPHGLANPDVIKTIAVLRSRGDPRWEGVPEGEGP